MGERGPLANVTREERPKRRAAPSSSQMTAPSSLLKCKLNHTTIMLESTPSKDIEIDRIRKISLTKDEKDIEIWLDALETHKSEETGAVLRSNLIKKRVLLNKLKNIPLLIYD
jgi:hypothetical protein